jgi:AraC family transcriptional regulator
MHMINDTLGVFSVNDTHPTLTYPSHRTCTSSERLKWKAMFLALKTDQPTFTVDCEPAADVLLVLQLTGSTRLRWSVQGTEEEKLGMPGSISIIPAGVRFHLQAASRTPVETAHLYLRHQLIDELLADSNNSGTPLTPCLAVKDPFLEQLIQHCVSELKQPTCGTSLYTDGLAWSVAAHLVTRYRADLTDKNVGTPELKHRRIDKVRRHIENNLERKISIDELAQVAALSPVYFARWFKHTLGLPPHQYLLNARVIRAQQLLVSSPYSTSEIAMRCGFCHQEHMHKVFRRLCAMTPGEYRQHKSTSTVSAPEPIARASHH